MARELDHIALANRNHDALIYLMEEAERFPEWITTVAFYKAVQIVEAVLASSRAAHSTSHHQRLLSLKMVQFKAIFKEYRPLLGLSRIARYLEDGDDRASDKKTVIKESLGAFRCFSDCIPARDVVGAVVWKRLWRLEQAALPYLSTDAKALLTKLEPPRKTTSA